MAVNYSGPDATKVKNMFSEIASQYDKANDYLSLGIHHLWRKKLVKWSGATAGNSVLDCATGTGDLAIEFKKVVKAGKVVGTDFCAEMLETAPSKAKAKGFDISFSVADVMALPFADKSFDISSIAFGIRNVQDPKKGLSELARVTRPGGYVMVLEFGQPRVPLFSQAFNLYSKYVLPKVGGMITGKPQAYSYLENSSAKFPCRKDFVNLALSTKAFHKVEFVSLSGGIAYIYKCHI